MKSCVNTSGFSLDNTLKNDPFWSLLVGDVLMWWIQSVKTLDDTEFWFQSLASGFLLTWLRIIVWETLILDLTIKFPT